MDLSKEATFPDERLKILLKSLLIVCSLTSHENYPPSLTNFVLQLLKMETRMSGESRDLLVRLILKTGHNHSTALILIRNNLFQRLLMTQFSVSEEGLFLAMKLVVVLYENSIAKVLLADRGFDAVILKEILLGNLTNEDTQDYAAKLLNELPTNTRVQKLWKAVTDRVATKGSSAVVAFSRDLFDVKFILTGTNRQIIVDQINAAVARYLERLNTSEEDILFDYSGIDPEHQEDAAFTKIGTMV